MFTENDRRELARLLQKRRRNADTGTRRSMLRWAKSDRGKRARAKYMANGGRAKLAAGRAPGTRSYTKIHSDNAASGLRALRHRQKWLVAEDSQLLKLCEGGKTAREISVILSRSFRAIERRREKLKKSCVASASPRVGAMSACECAVSDGGFLARLV